MPLSEKGNEDSQESIVVAHSTVVPTSARPATSDTQMVPCCIDPRGQRTAQIQWHETPLTWLLYDEGGEPGEVLCPLIPAVAGVKQPLLHTAVIGPAIPHSGVLDGEQVEAR